MLRKIVNTVVTDTSIMASGDTINSTIIEFKNVVPVGSQSGTIRELTIVDADHNSAANLVMTAWFFTGTVTQAASNAAHALTDADALLTECFITSVAANTVLSSNNSVSNLVPATPIPFVLPSGTSLFCILQSGATPTFTSGATGLQVTLTVDS